MNCNKNGIHHGMNRTAALRIAHSLGCTFETVSGTGEGQLSHPHMEHAVRFNNRKKSAPRNVTKFLLSVAKTLKK